MKERTKEKKMKELNEKERIDKIGKTKLKCVEYENNKKKKLKY